MLAGRIKRPADAQASRQMLPVIGKIKIGEKAPNGAPRSLDYFRCDSKYAAYFTEAYGEKPDAIQVLFVSDDISQSCSERYELRDTAGALVGRADGETYELYNSTTNQYEPENSREIIAARTKQSGGKWQPILTLTFILPKIRGVFGAFQFTTKADASSIQQIREAFDLVQANAKTVVGIPFDLVVKKVKSQKPGRKHLFPVVQLISNIGAENLAIVSTYIQQGNDIKQLGLLTESKIAGLLPQ